MSGLQTKKDIYRLKAGFYRKDCVYVRECARVVSIQRRRLPRQPWQVHQAQTKIQGLRKDRSSMRCRGVWHWLNRPGKFTPRL